MPAIAASGSASTNAPKSIVCDGKVKEYSDSALNLVAVETSVSKVAAVSAPA